MLNPIPRALNFSREYREWILVAPGVVHWKVFYHQKCFSRARDLLSQAVYNQGVPAEFLSEGSESCCGRHVLARRRILINQNRTRTHRTANA